MKLSGIITPYCASQEPRHQIRYSRRPDGLFLASVLTSAGFGPGFVVQPAAFIRITRISPRDSLGTVSVDAAQYTALTGMPVKGAERYDDDLLTAATAI